MKIAVPVNGTGKIDGHFGHCEYYNVYSVSDNKQIDSTERIDSEQGCGCKSNIASVLSSMGVSLMLAGGIGEGAVQVLKNAGIDVIRGCSGSADEVVKSWLDGSLTDSGVNCNHHHNHGDDHNCSH